MIALLPKDRAFQCKLARLSRQAVLRIQPIEFLDSGPWAVAAGE